MDLMNTRHRTPPPPPEEVPIISSLYVLAPSCEMATGLRVNPAGLLSALTPYMNWSSTLYLLSSDLRNDFTFLKQLIDYATSFLATNQCFHLTIRPVHPVPAKDADTLMEHYTRLMALVRPFQREGYTAQSISRLLVFPVLFLKDLEEYSKAIRIGDYANNCFMLPSIAIPACLADRLEAGVQGQRGVPQPDPGRGRTPGPGPWPWLRLYITPTENFDPYALIHLFYDHQVASLLSTDASPESLLCLVSVKGPNFSVTVTASGSLDICPPESPLAGSRPSLPRGSPGASLTADGIRQALCSKAAAREPLEQDYEKRLRSLRESLDRLEPSFVINREGRQLAAISIALAALFEQRGTWKEALSECQRASRLDPALGSQAVYWLRTGICHYHLGDYDAAMGSLEKAYALSPAMPEVGYYMGLCEYAWRDYILATERLSQVLSLNPPPALRRDTCFYLGVSHYLLQEVDEALHWLGQALELGRADASLHFYLGLTLLAKNRPREALDHLNRSLSIEHTTSETFNILFYIAHTHKELGSYEEALAALEKAQALESQSYEVFNLKGFCLFQLRRLDEAIQALETAVRIDPASAIDYASIGSCLRDKGELAAARDMYKKALAIDPAIDFARENLARIEAILGS
jgi:tetratricopeptide (TPR) repeat protein